MVRKMACEEVRRIKLIRDTLVEIRSLEGARTYLCHDGSHVPENRAIEDECDTCIAEATKYNPGAAFGAILKERYPRHHDNLYNPVISRSPEYVKLLHTATSSWYDSELWPYNNEEDVAEYLKLCPTLEVKRLVFTRRLFKNIAKLEEERKRVCGPSHYDTTTELEKVVVDGCDRCIEIAAKGDKVAAFKAVLSKHYLGIYHRLYEMKTFDGYDKPGGDELLVSAMSTWPNLSQTSWFMLHLLMYLEDVQ